MINELHHAFRHICVSLGRIKQLSVLIHYCRKELDDLLYFVKENRIVKHAIRALERKVSNHEVRH